MGDDHSPRAIIFGCSGITLTAEEKSFFKRSQPLGFILFARNCESPDQIQQLIHDLKQTVDHAYVPILIDQEGGRVARLRPPHWRDYPAMSVFGKMALVDMETALWSARTNGYLMGHELNKLGINVNCAPVVDLFHPNTHQIIGDRAFSDDPAVTAQLAIATAEGLIQAGVTPVLKHIPGHGRSLVDSHEALPVISTSLDDLVESDFEAFHQICQTSLTDKCWGMTAHLVYDKIDDKNPATQSGIVIQAVIRQHIGFKGLLISDCITMKALSGTYSQRALLSLQAGCDVALHCSGELEEMMDIYPEVPLLSDKAKQRLNAALATTHGVYRNVNDLEAQLTQHLRPYLEIKSLTA